VLTPELDAFITRMPKVELHIHLEGTAVPQTLLELAQQNHVEISAKTVADVEQLFRYHTFSDFLNVFMDLARAFKRGEDFERLAYEMALRSAAQNVVYSEVMISPMQHVPRQVNLLEAVQGMAAGFDRAKQETGIQAVTCLDYGRQYGVEQAWHVLEMAKPAMEYGLVGWSIGGYEPDYPPEPYREVFAAARAMGLRVMAHAGEVVGPPSIWGAVDVLECERIGHGIRSISDPALVAHLRDKGVTLDICPTSNVCTGAVKSLAEHPLRQLFEAGVRLTINSDDPTFFHTTITDEYRLAVDYFGFSVDDLCHTVLDAVQATFLPPDQQANLYQRVNNELTALRRELGV
jgi:adenosine deaminase